LDILFQGLEKFSSMLEDVQIVILMLKVEFFMHISWSKLVTQQRLKSHSMLNAIDVDYLIETTDGTQKQGISVVDTN
jgi:hypothetical protein